MERIIVIDHAAHTVYIEDVSDETLAKYNGCEEDYIKDNYTFEGDYSWDYITDIEYVDELDDVYEIEPLDWFD